MDRIHEDIKFLVWYKTIYLELVDIITSNPEINTGNLFWDWISRNYVSSSLMGIRRQIDKDGRAISLVRLLDDVAGNANLLTRDFYTSLYPEDMQVLAHRHFDGLAGPSAAHYPHEKAEADAQLLTELGKSFRDYIDRRLAHADKAAEVRIGTFKELYDGIDDIEKLFRKYYLLLTATDIRLIPVPQYDWKAIFRVPWIREEGRRSSN